VIYCSREKYSQIKNLQITLLHIPAHSHPCAHTHVYIDHNFWDVYASHTFILSIPYLVEDKADFVTSSGTDRSSGAKLSTNSDFFTFFFLAKTCLSKQVQTLGETIYFIYKHAACLCKMRFWHCFAW